MSAPICHACADTGSLSGDIDGSQDCTTCDAVERRNEMYNHLIGLSPYMSVGAKAWAAYQFALRRPLPIPPSPDFAHFLSYSGLSGEPADVLEKMRRAFEAARPSEAAQLVPVGWRLVPNEPTYAMLIAMDASFTCMESYESVFPSYYQPANSEFSYHKDAYAAMLAAAPLPEAGSAAPSGEVEQDAARYRWLRDFGPENKPAVMIEGRWYGAKLGNGVGFDLDTAIDAAMALEKK